MIARTWDYLTAWGNNEWCASAALWRADQQVKQPCLPKHCLQQRNAQQWHRCSATQHHLGESFGQWRLPPAYAYNKAFQSQASQGRLEMEHIKNTNKDIKVKLSDLYFKFLIHGKFIINITSPKNKGESPNYYLQLWWKSTLPPEI